MRWMWVDHILELTPRERIVAVKHVSLGDDHLDLHFPADWSRRVASLPVMPTSLVIEGMAQTAGIFVSDAGDYRHKVVLAKVSHCEVHEDARNGDTLRYTATIERMDAGGAATRGEVAIRPAREVAFRVVGRIDLMFSHLENNLGGKAFPRHNFVLGDSFRNILANSGLEVRF